MAYQIFVSHTKDDTPIAQAVTTIINNAFRGRLELYLAVNEIVGGATWKEEVKEKIDKSDAIISIVTCDSINKPWIYIEWSPFWFQNKRYYTLLTSDIGVSQLIQPMHDRQTTDMTDRIQVESFFQALANDSHADIPIPWHKANEFIAAVEKGEKTKQSNAYSVFRVSLKKLPNDDISKQKIAHFFYQEKEWDTFGTIVNRIANDGIKHDMAIEALNEDQTTGLYQLIQHIGAADKLVYIALAIIKKGDLDHNLLRELLEDISIKNQAELRKVLIFLASNDQEDTDLFSYICSLMTNMAEYRKVAIYFVQNNRLNSIIFEDLVENITNMAELRKVAIELLTHNKQDTKQFFKIIKLLYL
ncbi:hypothetical protein MHK_008383, partial [Candidatus Magnetomorum sp. HK-1]